MVQRGQFLERPTLIPVADVVMEGMSHRGARRPPLLVIPPQPEQGSGMDHVVCAELVWAAARAGHPTVRFNHRGIGGSQGKSGQGSELLEDAEAALGLALDNASAAQALVAGVLSGAATARALVDRLGQNDPSTSSGRAERPLGVSLSNPFQSPLSRTSIAGLLLISPSGIGPEALGELELPFLVVLGEDEPRELRSRWNQAAREAGGELELVPGADVRYQRNLPELGRWAVHLLSRLSTR